MLTESRVFLQVTSIQVSLVSHWITNGHRKHWFIQEPNTALCAFPRRSDPLILLLRFRWLSKNSKKWFSVLFIWTVHFCSNKSNRIIFIRPFCKAFRLLKEWLIRDLPKLNLILHCWWKTHMNRNYYNWNDSQVWSCARKRPSFTARSKHI